MDTLDRNKLSAEEERLLAPCGIYCGACDIFLGKSMRLAKELHRIMDGFNIRDIAPFVMETEQEQISDFLAILEQWGNGKQCPGCIKGGGNPNCPIETCAQEKGLYTCAECDRMPCYQPCYQDKADKNDDLFSPESLLGLITKRYSGWNIENLKQIQKIGYRRFIDEMQARVKDGFLTSDVISREMVMTESMKTK